MLKRKKQTLQKKNIQLEKLERLKTDFYNMLIHDWKGPISDLRANLDILSYSVSDEDKEFVEASKTACDTLYSMVFNLLDISQLEEDRLKLLHEKIDPQDLIKESLDRLFGHFKLKELTFVEKVPSAPTADFFWGDRGILLRVLQNLLTNAINYSPPSETIEIGFEYKERMEKILCEHKVSIPLTRSQEQDIKKILDEARDYYRERGFISDEDWKIYKNKVLKSSEYPFA